MTRWEYCEVQWQPQGVRVTQMNAAGDHLLNIYSAHDSYTVLAQLGAEGWELTDTLASPTGIHEYWYYFKRPLGGA